MSNTYNYNYNFRDDQSNKLRAFRKQQKPT